jgi:hypothetical protein
MAPRIKSHSTRYLVNLLALLALAFHPSSAQALTLASGQPDLASFSRSVYNGQAGVLRGVYVQDVLAYPIVQQPSYNAAFVSNTDGVVTEFSPATQTGNVGLLAHNTLAGKAFTNMKLGQKVIVIFGDSKTETFVITKILRFAALSPYSVKSEFKNLDTNITISATQLFSDVYNGPRHLTFQTCIAYNGNDSWGRLFIIAQPVK